ncbi:hypothetical protein GGS24DRAFT_449850 [Hypoxylon argillaceum]|nr:hypothetical protein GGS24DRAFT_449850 [Hypoxylon argillaceum]
MLRSSGVRCLSGLWIPVVLLRSLGDLNRDALNGLCSCFAKAAMKRIMASCRFMNVSASREGKWFVRGGERTNPPRSAGWGSGTRWLSDGQ